MQDFESPIADPVSFVAADVTFNIRDLERRINEVLNPVLVREEMFEAKKVRPGGCGSSVPAR